MVQIVYISGHLIVIVNGCPIYSCKERGEALNVVEYKDIEVLIQNNM